MPFIRLIKLLFVRAFGLDGSATGQVLFPLFLLLLNKLDELFDVLHRVEIHIVEVFTLRTIHELMLLTGEVCDNAFQNRRDISLASTIQLKVGDHVCKLFKISWSHGRFCLIF